MKAVVVRAGKKFALEEIKKPSPGPGEILLQIHAAGICAADRKIYAGTHPWQLPDPYIPGHEYVGEVVEMGTGAAEASNLSAGDIITAEIIVPCRTCWFCHRGAYHHCDRPQVAVGAWAEYLLLPAGAILHKIPTGLKAQEAVLVEPLACSIHAVNLAQIGLEDTVVIAGLGAIGMGALQAARLRSPRHLIGIDVDRRLLEIARSHGADGVLHANEDDLEGEIHALTEGRGADIYIEVSGATDSVTTGIKLLRKAGRLVVFGVYGQPATIDLNQLSEFKELNIVGGHLSPYTYPLAIEYLAKGWIDAEMMVTDAFNLKDYESAIRAKQDSEAASIKTILIPG